MCRHCAIWFEIGSRRWRTATRPRCHKKLVTASSLLSLPRLLIYYPFSSIIALFASISGNPTQPSARNDLELITAGRHFFEKLSNSFEVAPKLIDITEGFERTASQIVFQDQCRKRDRSDYDTSPERHMQDMTQQMYSAE